MHGSTAADPEGPLRPHRVTRAGLVGMAALTAVVVAVWLFGRANDAGPPLAEPTPTPTQVVAILSEDLSDWEVTGPGRLSLARGGKGVWTATGKGRVTWPQPVADVVVEAEFQFPEGPVNAGVLVRIPQARPYAGVAVELDANADGRARVGHIAGLVSPLVYVEPHPGEWHTVRVSVLGERVLVDVDGQHIADWLDMGAGEGRMAAEGEVALQFSDGIRFRSVQLAQVSP